jgi:hypothetical protein
MRCHFTFQVTNFQVGRRLDSSVESAAANSLLVPFIERDRRQHPQLYSYSGLWERAGESFLSNLDAITVEQMCETAEKSHVLDDEKVSGEFAI